MKSRAPLQCGHQLVPPFLPAESGNKLLAKANLSLPADERLILGLSLSRTRFAAGEYILNGEIDRVLFVEQGIAGETILTSDGESLGISIIGCEGALGLRGMGSGGDGFQVRALTNVEALQINAMALAQACSRNSALKSLLRDYSHTLLSDSVITMMCHVHHNLHKRVPRWLLVAADRLRSTRLPITQEVLAEAHGVSAVAIGKALDALESKGIVARARRKIIILSRGKLRSKACRCYSDLDQGKKYIVDSRDFCALLSQC
jgi:CRP-like cAMP-binding protein